jgi:hypothetical protein
MSEMQEGNTMKKILESRETEKMKEIIAAD